MMPVIKNLPLKSLDCTQSENMTPDEVAAWLDECESQVSRQRVNWLLNFGLGVVSVALVYVTVQLFTR